MKKRYSRRAQVSIEALLAFGIILVFFIALLGYSLDRGDYVRGLKDVADKKADCLTLANNIVGAYNNPGSDIIVRIIHNATIKSNLKFIDVEDVPCTLPVKKLYQENITLEKGRINIYFENESIVVQTI